MGGDDVSIPIPDPKSQIGLHSRSTYRFNKRAHIGCEQLYGNGHKNNAEELAQDIRAAFA